MPKSAQPHVATQVRTIFDQADADAVAAQFDRVVAALGEKFGDAAAHLDDARADLLASPPTHAKSGARSGRTTPRNG